MSSEEPDGKTLLDILADNVFEQMIPTPNSKSLDVALTNIPQNLISVKTAVDFSSLYSINKEQLLGLDAF